MPNGKLSDTAQGGSARNQSVGRVHGLEGGVLPRCIAPGLALIQAGKLTVAPVSRPNAEALRAKPGPKQQGYTADRDIIIVLETDEQIIDAMGLGIRRLLAGHRPLIDVEFASGGAPLGVAVCPGNGRSHNPPSCHWLRR